MAEKILNSRIVHKHDVEANWLKAVNFVPRQGELIVYDIDDTYHYERIKIGDGVQNVNDLPFITETDPTVPAWAKAPTKPTYTAREVGADVSGAAASALEEAKAYVDANVNTKANANDLAGHISDKANPHNVTADQINAIQHTSQTLNEEQQAQARLNIGAGTSNVHNWDELPGKPVVMQGGDTSDTLTWDGNTDGLEVYSELFYKVSDAVPAKTDFADGFTLQLNTGESYTGTVEDVGEEGNVIIVSEAVAIIPNDFTAEDGSVHSKGTYFVLNNEYGMYTSFLTIPGYTGFAQEKIDPAYLYQPDFAQTDESQPDAIKNLPFGDFPTGSDTLKWDDAKFTQENMFPFQFDGMHFQMSEAAPTLDDFKNGATITIDNGSVVTITANDITTEDQLIFGYLNSFVIVPQDMTMDGVALKKGTYLQYGDGFYISSLTIPGYTGFPSVKKLDEKYLPDAIARTEDVAEATAETLTEAKIYTDQVGAVSYLEQALTDEQQSQARVNIGAQLMLKGVKGQVVSFDEQGNVVSEDMATVIENSKTRIIADFEYGPVNSVNGSDDTDSVSIRTPLPAFPINGSIVIKNNDIALYRVRVRGMSNRTGGSGTIITDSDWITVAAYDMTADANLYYRIQIATRDGSDINLENAMSAVIITVYDETTSENAIPDYWRDYLNSKISAIHDLLRNGATKTCFMALADTHYYGGDLHDINANILAYISKYTNCDTIVHLGDINSEHSDPVKALKFMREPYQLMKSAVKNVYPVRGNHDDNQEGDRGWNDCRITQSDSYSYMFRGINARFGNSRTYYYSDNDAELIRFIALDSSDMIYDSSENWQKLLAFGAEQLQWLCDVLQNTPKGYSVIIIIHSMLAPSNVTIENPDNAVQTRAKNYIAVCEILKAYKNRNTFSYVLDGSFSTFHSEYYSGTLNANFSACESDIVAVFSGHEHVDCIEEILDADGIGIGIYNTCMQNSSSMFDSTIISSSYQALMTLGTTTEHVYDFIIVDTDSRHVDLVRIGAGNDDMRSFDY